MACIVCSHPKRYEIEQKLLCRNSEEKAIPIEAIAKEYGLKTIDLQVHALMHNTMVSESEDVKPMTLVASIKYKEGEYIRQVINDYQLTMSVLGGEIRAIIKNNSDDNPTLSRLSKPVVDLYLGLGTEIRGSVDLLNKMNGAVNGDANPALEGLKSLVNAIQSSGGSDDSI